MQITWRIVLYRGNRLLSFPGPVACYRYFVHLSRKRKLRRVVHNVLPKLPNIFRKRKHRRQRSETLEISLAVLHESSRTVAVELGHRHREREREREREEKKKRNRGSNEGRRKNEKSNYAESEREKERDEETGEGVDSLGDFVRAGTRFPNRSNLQLANRRRRQPSNKSNSRRNGRGPKGKKRVRRDFAPRMIRSSRTKSISCRLDYAVWHTFLRRSNSSSLYVHTYVRTNVHLA